MVLVKILSIRVEEVGVILVGLEMHGDKAYVDNI